VYRGVRIAGLNMSLKHSQNKGAPHFPHDFPDCPAGVRFQEEQEVELLDKFRRRPPAKRPNYIKQGCLAPFCCPWQQLAEEWDLIERGGGEEERKGVSDATMEVVTSHKDVAATTLQSRFTVLRNRKSLRLLSAWCRPTTSKGQRLGRVAEPPPLNVTAKACFLKAHGTSLVWVRLSLLSKGKPDLHAAVCVPTTDDLKLLSKGRGSSGPQEPPHKDHFKSRVKRRQKNSRAAAADQTDADLVLGLWPEPLPSVTSHCSRLTLGWVTQGDFSLSAGCGEALGFVSVAGLLHTLVTQPPEHRGTVLLRNPTSLHYRFTKVNIEV
ncbi:unnamed protein product, partial [Lampetra planeri]